MVQINFAQKQVKAKIVYYGPGMSGKTTNLEVVHQRAPDHNRGDLTSISTDGDRTLFFDYMPLDLGTVAGMKTTFQIYTVPGQVYYNSTRKLVLQGVDGVIFVADSGASMTEENLESLRNLEENLNEYGKSLATLPHIIQYNKRDLPDAMSVEELDKLMNHHNAPTFEATANTGQGVFPTLKALASGVLKNIMQERSGGNNGAAGNTPLSQTGVQPNPAAAAPAPAPQAAMPQPQPMAPEPQPLQAAPQASAPQPAPPAPAPAPPPQAAPPQPQMAPQAAMHQTGFRPATPSPTPPPAPQQAQAAPGTLQQTGYRARPASLMDTATRPAPAGARPRARGAQPQPQQSQARPSQQRREQRAPAPTVEPKRSKTSLVFTIGFVLLAGVVGALVARFAMQAL